MKWCVALVLVGVCGAQDPVAAELARLRERVAQLEAQRQEQEEINGLLLRAMDATTEKLELFLRAVEDGSLPAQPVTAEPVAVESPAGEPDGWTTALAVTGLALGFGLLAWLWNRRSPVAVVDGVVPRQAPPMREQVPSMTEQVAVKPELAPAIELDVGAALPAMRPMSVLSRIGRAILPELRPTRHRP